MDFYELELDEAIILQSSNVSRNGYDESEFEEEFLREILLTNKRIIYVIAMDDLEEYEDCDVISVPLSAVKVINGQVQVKQVQHDSYGLCLQVQFIHGVEYWRFGIKAKQQIPCWVSEFCDAVLAAPRTLEESNYKKVSQEQPQILETQKAPENFYPAAVNSDFCFCVNCGAKMLRTAKFCYECGAQVGVQRTVAPEQRKTVYDGELHKCPNCGELLKSFTTVCPTCAYELRSVTTNSHVEALARKIEMASSLDDKIELIANFYIPNTREDIYDFFILAVSNLEDNWYDTDDAWSAKLEQAYHKAQLSFGNTPEFDYLEKLYTRTRKTVSKRERGIATLFRKHKYTLVSTILVIIGIIMLGIFVVLMTSGDESGAGAFLMLFSLMFIMSPFSVSVFKDDADRKNKKKKKTAPTKQNNSMRAIGIDYYEFYRKNYDDMVEYLKARGFRNVVAKPVKKGLLDTEGAVGGISVAGNTEFDGDDEFDIDSTIIIRYYSRKR